jgi:hypothetical protein
MQARPPRCWAHTSCAPTACHCAMRNLIAVDTQVFELWFKMLHDQDKFFRRAYDKKLVCTGLVSLLALPVETLPAAIASSLPLVRPPLLHISRADPNNHWIAWDESQLTSDWCPEMSEAGDPLCITAVFLCNSHPALCKARKSRTACCSCCPGPAFLLRARVQLRDEPSDVGWECSSSRRR